MGTVFLSAPIPEPTARWWAVWCLWHAPVYLTCRLACRLFITPMSLASDYLARRPDGQPVVTCNTLYDVPVWERVKHAAMVMSSVIRSVNQWLSWSIGHELELLLMWLKGSVVFAKVSVIGLRVLLSLIDRMGGHFKPYVTSGTLCVVCCGVWWRVCADRGKWVDIFTVFTTLWCGKSGDCLKTVSVDL